ncbi:MAG: DUF421 domain-containing protein [Clostridia bacterium]|nr:DUF421 domain-containing protein [Clostridia bacterium]
MATIFIRVLILYLVVLIALRLMGKREIGQLQPYELVITMMIADLASVPMQDIGIPLFHGIVPILALLFSQIVLSYINIKSGWVRKIVCGEPTVLIQKGKIMEDRLKKQRYTIDGLMEELRSNGVFSLDEVEYAILETSGQISIIKKPEKNAATKEDVNAQITYIGYPRLLIIDGSYIDKNLDIMGLKQEDVDKYLKQQKTEYKDVLVLMYDENNTYFLQKKDNKKDVD